MEKSDIEYLKGCLDRTMKGGTPLGEIWYTGQDAMITVAGILDGECCFSKTGDVISFFEKPHKWESDMQDLVNEFEGVD